MTCAKSWHRWRCDGCGREETIRHGEEGWPDIPPGWMATLGWGYHACSVTCREQIQAKHQEEFGKVFIFLDPGERTGIDRRPEKWPPPSAAPPAPPPAQKRRGRPPKVRPGVFG